MWATAKGHVLSYELPLDGMSDAGMASAHAEARRRRPLVARLRGTLLRALGGVVRGTFLSRMWVRTVLLAVADATLVAGAVYLTFVLRFDDLNPAEITQWLPIALAPILIRPLLNRAFGLYAHSWRYISVPEMVRVVVAVVTGTLLLFAGYSLLALLGAAGTVGFPRSYWILEALLSGAAMASLRIAPRLSIDARLRFSSRGTQPNEGSRTILFGAGEAGALMVRAAFRQPNGALYPVAFLDDDPRTWGRQHAGVPVMGGLSSLAAVAKATQAKTVLITMPSVEGAKVRVVADAALDLGLQVRTAPTLDEMMHGNVDPQAVRPLRPEDLLRREPVSAEALADLRAEVADEVVLVTGAGGSIGSELAMQLLTLGPRRLVLLDRAEGALYDVQRAIETRQRRESVVPLDVTYQIADITNRVALRRIMRAVRPSLVFHAAAYKHVPMMESHPLSAIEVNVGGTLALLDVAAECDVRRFVLVSTDKAVEPSSVMGATKRLAEMLMAQMGRELGRPWVAVRFGNVLGSSGSVVPIFRKQLEAGEPLTVTHHEMTRYFMTIPEAVHLILQAAALAQPADLFVLDMGEPVRILDLARDVIRLSGHDWNTARIEFVGLRPGEKLHERLFYETERVEATSHPKIHRVAQVATATSARAVAHVLLKFVRAGDELGARRLLMDAVSRHEPIAERPWTAVPMESPTVRARVPSEQPVAVTMSR